MVLTLRAFVSAKYVNVSSGQDVKRKKDALQDAATSSASGVTAYGRANTNIEDTKRKKLKRKGSDTNGNL